MRTSLDATGILIGFIDMLAGLAHRPDAEDLLGFIAVMCPAPQLDVLDRRLPAGRVGLDVMELQEAPLLAAPPRAADERALPAVALPHRPPDLCRDVPGPGDRGPVVLPGGTV